MAIVSISEAAKLAGCARSTIYDYIKTGKLSVTTGADKKTKTIDTSELIRVFGRLNDSNVATKSDNSERQVIHERTEIQTVRISELEKENEKLKALLSEKEERIKDKQAHIESLDNAMRLLEDQRQKAPLEEPKKEEPKGFFKRLFS